MSDGNKSKGDTVIARARAARDRFRRIFTIPIDHVLATGQIDIVSFRVLPAGGSDHNPVIAEIVIR